MTGFEWTSTPKGDNPHRVVIFADYINKTSRTVPFSMFDSEDPEDLWNYLEQYDKTTGGRAMAIPHNGNLSNGLMFNGMGFGGKPIIANYARRRMRYADPAFFLQPDAESRTGILVPQHGILFRYGAGDVTCIPGLEIRKFICRRKEWVCFLVPLHLGHFIEGF